ncbi:MAG: GGDEF domain-containing protein [Thiobacillus sp.]|nr:GGDEF domain-containing protein [Thiobacillus sp.]
MGGDEFVVVIEELADPDEVAGLAEELIALLGQPFKLSQGQVASIGGSIGIALFPSDGDDVDSLLDNADAALYLAKKAGRNTWRCHGQAD